MAFGKGRSHAKSHWVPPRLPNASCSPVRGRPRPPHRLSARRPSRRSWPSGLLAVAAGLGWAGFMAARAHSPDCASAAQDEIIDATQGTQEEGNNPTLPSGLVSQADRLASCGGGELFLDRGVGQGGVQAGPAISLHIYREPGEVDNDPQARACKVQRLLTHALRTSDAIRPPGTSWDLVGLLLTVFSSLRQTSSLSSAIRSSAWCWSRFPCCGRFGSCARSGSSERPGSASWRPGRDAGRPGRRDGARQIPPAGSGDPRPVATMARVIGVGGVDA